MRVPRIFRRRLRITFALLAVLPRAEAAPVFKTELVADLPPVDRLMFDSDPGPGVELWRSDATADGTTMVKNIQYRENFCGDIKLESMPIRRPSRTQAQTFL